MKLASIGKQCLLELHGCPSALLGDAGRMEEAVRCAARLSGLPLVHASIRALAPQGISAIAIFQEGHLCVHAWTREGVVAMDLFSAKQECQPLAACRSLIFDLEARHYSLTLMDRQLAASGKPTVRLLSHPLSVTGKRKEAPPCTS